MEDTKLVRLCQNGDILAFERLFRKYQDQVHNIAYRMMNNREDAMDLSQEIFLRAYQKIGKFDFKSAFFTWLYRLAVNICIDDLRKRKMVRTEANQSLIEPAMQVDKNTPEDSILSKELESQIWNALDSLKEKERAIIILKDIEGLSYIEIAEIFKCSLGRVKSRLHEARQKLKTILETKTELLTY